jgi:hypothetical protein
LRIFWNFGSAHIPKHDSTTSLKAIIPREAGSEASGTSTGCQFTANTQYLDTVGDAYRANHWFFIGFLLAVFFLFFIHLFSRSGMADFRKAQFPQGA